MRRKLMIGLSGLQQATAASFTFPENRTIKALLRRSRVEIYNVFIRRSLVLDAPIGCSSRQNFTLGTSYRSFWYSVDCQRVLLQAGAILRRYSQVAKKSVSQSL